jgi:hypothetical protein
LLLKNDDVVEFKRLYNKIKEDQSLTLVSTNSAYAPYPMHINQVIEIWKFETWNGFEF